MKSKFAFRNYGMLPLLTCFAFVGFGLNIVAALPAPVAYWDFDEGSGTILHDRTGNGHDGTIVGSPAWAVGGIKATALSFNGSTHVEIPASTSFSLLRSFTLSVWVWQDAENSVRPVMEFSQPGWLTGTMLWVNTTGYGVVVPGSVQGCFRSLVSQSDRSGYQFSTPGNIVPTSQWNHFVLTYDSLSHTGKTYVNGVFRSSLTIPSTYFPSMAGSLYLGWRPTTSIESLAGTHFLGQLDEVRVYSAALSATQIDSLYSSSFTPAPPSNLSFSKNPAVYEMGIPITLNTPNVRGTAPITYSVTPALPPGLTLNTTTGIISGTPTTISASAYYTVTAGNHLGATSTSINITVTTNPAGQTHFSLNSSTVALWTFNAHSGGNFLDRSPNGYSLSNANIFALTPSPFDSAVVFTGSQNYLSRAHTPALTMGGTGKLTYEARVYLTQFPTSANQGGVGVILCTYEGVRLQITSNGALVLGGQKVRGGTGYWYGALTAAGSVPLNRWVDLAVGFDNSNGEIYAYIDGAPFQLYVDPNSTYPTVNSDLWRVSTSAFAVGNSTVNNQPFTGTIDEIRVSNNLVLGAGLPLILGNSTPTPPSNLTYSQNPAVYGVGVAITSNIPTLAGTSPISYSVNPTLPTGLTLNTTTGVISGTPSSVSAAAYYVVTASNSYGITSTSVGITVQTTPPPSNLSYSTNPASYPLGTSITPNAATVRGTPPFTFSVSPSLPPGLTLNTSTGTISGIPTTARAFANYLVTANNTAGSTTITLVIATGVVVVGLNQQPDARRFTLKVSGSSSLVFLLPGNARDGRLEILDTKGVKIWESRAELESGESSLVWNGKINEQSISGGLYFARMTLMDNKRNRISTTVQRIVYSP